MGCAGSKGGAANAPKSKKKDGEEGEAPKPEEQPVSIFNQSFR